MGTKPSEEELFDSIIDPKDHKVIKYMLKSIGEDIYDKTKSLGRKIKSGATHILNAPLRVFRGYTKGYLNQEDALPTGAINATIRIFSRRPREECRICLCQRPSQPAPRSAVRSYRAL